MDIRELDRRALELIDKIVAEVRSDDLTLPTPCADWNLGELLRHLVSENQAFAIAARVGSAENWDGGDLGADPYGAYAASARAAVDAFGDDGMLEREVTVREFGTFPGSVAVTMHFIDSIAHGWDLARAMGQRYEPEPDLVNSALRITSQIPAGPDDRGQGKAFGAVVAVPDDAPEMHRLLGLLGRDPEWQP